MGGPPCALLVETACATLEASRGRIDDLNVFPVPDGDTGTNMARTADAVARALDERTPADAGAIAAAVTRAALLGARGNSGIILSQLVRGAVEELASHAAARRGGRRERASQRPAMPATPRSASPSRGRC